jgi:hypothetical protein
MLKKTITYTDLNDQEVTEDFYFNFSKLELMEKDLEMGGVEETVARLNETQNAKEAYDLFKKIVLSAYGTKSADGKRFIKEDDNGRPLSKYFEESPACSELIFEFIENPSVGAAFIEATLPKKLVAEVKASQANEAASKPVTTTELPTAPPVLEDEDQGTKEPTDEELLKMKPQDMTHAQLQRAFALKSAQ